MAFHPMNMTRWKRREYYQHYIDEVVCSYSLCVDLDITGLRGQRLYPAMLWLLADTVNAREEFRTDLTPQGVGVYDIMHPSYTIFHKEQESFSVIWTAFQKEYAAFLRAYERDVAQYASSSCFCPQPDRPGNTFDVSMLPWTKFTSFHLHVAGEGKHLLPIFTMGKRFIEGDKTLLPLAVQVHHAVCDGYHVGWFLERLQDKIHHFAEYSTEVEQG